MGMLPSTQPSESACNNSTKYCIAPCLKIPMGSWSAWSKAQNLLEEPQDCLSLPASSPGHQAPQFQRTALYVPLHKMLPRYTLQWVPLLKVLPNHASQHSPRPCQSCHIPLPLQVPPGWEDSIHDCPFCDGGKAETSLRF